MELGADTFTERELRAQFATVTFTEFTRRAVGDPDFTPYRYQQRLANDGLPDIVRAPTGAGKTLGAVLGWLYRRREHPDRAVRADTPRWLVFVLPQRSLVEQTAKVIDGWLANLGAPVRRYSLMAGVHAEEREWMRHPDRDAIFVGTQDAVLSRLLMRGHAEPPARWPVSFGLLHAGVQFVFDEAQLLGPGLGTSLRLQGWRERLGAAQPCRTMWMSATLDPARITELAPDPSRAPRVMELDDDDRNGPLRTRLEATRLIRRIEVEPRRYASDLAERVLAEHQPGTRTLVVLNTVDRAQDTFDAMAGVSPPARVVLLHPRFRPGERARQVEDATADPPEEGVIVVSTRAVEAGMDLTSDTLFTELAPWS